MYLGIISYPEIVGLGPISALF